jgi:dolichol-phosphate mannosyltransferase
VLVIIPTLNEAIAIGDTIESIKEHVLRCAIAVVDSYSSDETADIAVKCGADVLDAPRGGKGVALRAVIKELDTWYPQARYWVMIDGDFTYPANRIPDLVQQMRDGADVVMGYRICTEDKAMSRINHIWNWGLSLLASTLYTKRVRDVCTGMWGFKRDVIARFNITSPRFTLEADLFTNTMRGRWKLAQIPVEYRARKSGDRSKLKVSDGFDIGWFLVTHRFG